MIAKNEEMSDRSLFLTTFYHCLGQFDGDGTH